MGSQRVTPQWESRCSVDLQRAASWEDAADDTANLEWARTAWRDMRGFSAGGGIRQLPHRRGGRADPRRLWEESRQARWGQDEVGPWELVPNKQEHRAAGIMKGLIGCLEERQFLSARVEVTSGDVEQLTVRPQGQKVLEETLPFSAKFSCPNPPTCSPI